MKHDKHRTLWEITRGQRLRYGAAIGAMWLGIVFMFGVPLVSMAVIDTVLEGETAESSPVWVLAILPDLSRGAETLWVAGLSVVLLTALGGACHYLRARWAASASEAIVERLRNLLYRHLERLPCAFHDRADTGDLVQRCSSDVETLRVFLAGQIVEIGRTTLLLVSVTPILWFLDARMTLVSLGLFPIIVFFAVIFFRRIRALFLLTDEAEGRMTTVLQENLTGIRVVRAFARQDFEREKFGEKNAAFRDHNYRLIQLLGYYWSISDLLCMGQVGVVLIAGAHLTLAGELSVGTLAAFLTYEAMVIWPVRQLGRVLTETGKAIVALGRIEEILGEPEEEDPPALEDPSALAGEIRVSGLGHVFGDGAAGEGGEGREALADLSFHVRPGETLAMIGPPGCGKSTFVHLLLRLYDYQRGSIRLDGRELRELSRRFVRSQIGVVLQEPFLYSKTIEANVQLGRTGATRSEIVESATAAAIHDSIAEFKEGYESLIGERGVTLSGGQRQRIAIARALLKDPPILILDDALSAVDTHTETAILEALRRRRRDSLTTILIAHRLSSLRHADRILVMDAGRILQSGTHRELIRSEGPYRRLWAIQGELEDSIAGEPARSRPAGGSEGP